MIKKITYIISDIDKALGFEWIAEALPAQRYEQSYILLNPGPTTMERFLLDRGFQVDRVECRGKSDWLKAIWKVSKLLRKHKPDIVHCQLIQANIVGLTAARIAGIKRRIYTRHHSDYHHRYFPKGVWLDRYSNALATDIVAPSQVVREILTEQEGVPAAKVCLIPHGFDMAYFSEISEERVVRLQDKYQTAGYTPVVGVISRFTSLKGIQFIIPAFKKILEHYPQALLMLFNAKGDDAAQIFSQLSSLPENSYRTVPFEEDLSAVYRLFDVFVQASTDRSIEAFGQTYVEALATRTPSVFTLAGIAGDFVKDNQNALVVPFNDSDAIYEALMKLLNDEQLRTRLKEEGYRTVSAVFGLENMIAKLDRLYAR